MVTRGPILVVDGDESILDLLQMALEDEGFEVIASSDAERAVELLGASTPSLVLLDPWMAEASVREFAEAYRTYSRERAPLLIMTTGNYTTDWATEFGAESHIDKPFDIEELVAAVRRHTDSPTAGPTARPRSGGDPGS